MSDEKPEKELGRKTVNVEKEGDEDCKHSWTYENKVYLSMPVQSRKICDKCGRVEWEQPIQREKSSFDEIYEEKHGLKETNEEEDGGDV